MKIIKKCKKLFAEYFECPNRQLLDFEFHQILQRFYWFGLYQPTPSRQRAGFGVFMSVFISTCCLGALKSFLTSFGDGLGPSVLFNALTFSNTLCTQVKIMLFLLNQKEIVQLFGDFQSMHERDNDEILSIYRLMYFRLVKCYKNLIAALIVYMIMLKIIGVHYFVLFIPVLYDVLATRFAYAIFFMISIAHSCSLSMIHLNCDCLHVICMLRVEAHLKVLCKMLSSCTEDEDPRKNEKSLRACVKYHCRIIS